MVSTDNLFSSPPEDSSDKKDVYQKVEEYYQYDDQLSEKIDADNRAVSYSGKIDFSNKKAPIFSHAGVSIKTMFEGPDIDIIMEDNGDNNYYLVFIDKQDPQLLHLKEGKHIYTIARGLKKRMHSIEIFKRTESSNGTSIFYGFILQKDKRVHALKSSQLFHRNMLFIGDSITAGYGNDRNNSTTPMVGFDPRYENQYNAYGAITARNLKSNYQAICYSGMGMFRDYNGDQTYTMPRLYRQIAFEHKKQWDPADYIPDVVVINLGSNDYFSEISGKELDDALFKEAYLQFLKEIRNDYPNAEIICVIGCMINNYWPPERTSKTRMLKVISDIVKEFNQAGDQKVRYVEVSVSDTINGDDSHPTTPNHIEMAKKLEKFCRKVMKW